MQQLPSIWLVDDDENVADLIQRAFRQENMNCSIKAFPNAATLLSGIQQSTQLPELLLVDYYMPGTDGLQLIDYLRHHSPTQSLKLILFSQKITSDMVQRAESMAVYQVASKPSNFQQWREFAREICLAGHFP